MGDHADPRRRIRRGVLRLRRLLRGTDVVVNEVAIVRGAPDATEATAQVYFGVFSPTRATYQVDVPQRRAARLADQWRPVRRPGPALLDIVQGTGPEQPSAVRNLDGRDGLAARRPGAAADYGPAHARDAHVSRTARSAARSRTPRTRRSRTVAVVLGSSVVVLGDVAAPGEARRAHARSATTSSVAPWRTRSSALRSTTRTKQASGDRPGTRCSASSPSTRWAGRSASCPATRR